MKEDPLNKWTNMPPPKRLMYFIAWEPNESHYPKGGCWSIKIKILVKRSTIVVTNQFHGETKKDEDEAITVGSQMEDSNLIQLFYHITVEEGPYIDDTYDDVQEAPPQLEDGV
ncbi:hypothetical protein KY285_013387 [Solanum tuberosum]|nr:hypothetical protein KY289_014076 [Solanum tuberosum]KAH0717356.1 hypothetical protein KY285_013387 [Solanum tuberosum]